MTAEVEALVASVAPRRRPRRLAVGPRSPEPEIDEDDQPEPLCDSRWSFAEQTRRLIESKNWSQRWPRLTSTPTACRRFRRFPEPEVDEDDQPEPLCDSRWSFAVQTRRLIASKDYEI